MANEIRHVRVGGTTYDIVGRVEGVRLSVSEGASASGSAQVASDGTLDLSLTLPRAQGGAGGTGTPGRDGVSPTIAVEAITGGHRVTVTDANGAKSFDVLDGAAGSAQQADKSKLLSGLTIGVYGDSLFSGVNTRPLSEWLADYGVQADNYSSNGATLAAKDRSGSGQTNHNSILEQTWIGTRYDVAIIDGFENDYAFSDVDNIKFGAYLDTGNTTVQLDTTTYCGAMENAVDFLFNKHAKIIWVFPYQMQDERDVLSWHGKTKEGHTLEDYRDVTLRMCEDYGVTPVRLDHTSLNGRYTWQQNELFSCDEDIQNKSWDRDGIHPGSGAMGRYIMPVLVDAIRRVTGV